MQAITLIKQRIPKVIKPKEITLFPFDREHGKSIKTSGHTPAYISNIKSKQIGYPLPMFSMEIIEASNNKQVYEINKLLNTMKIKYNEYEYNENEYNENRNYTPNKGYSTIYEMLNAYKTYKKLL